MQYFIPWLGAENVEEEGEGEGKPVSSKRFLWGGVGYSFVILLNEKLIKRSISTSMKPYTTFLY